MMKPRSKGTAPDSYDRSPAMSPYQPPKARQAAPLGTLPPTPQVMVVTVLGVAMTFIAGTPSFRFMLRLVVSLTAWLDVALPVAALSSVASWVHIMSAFILTGATAFLTARNTRVLRVIDVSAWTHYYAWIAALTTALCIAAYYLDSQ